jgi:hypothetical protein
MPSRRVDWPQAWRVIAARYPPITLFERLTPDPAVWEALIALEQLTNPRVRDEIGDIALVPPEDRVTGPGARRGARSLRTRPRGDFHRCRPYRQSNAGPSNTPHSRKRWRISMPSCGGQGARLPPEPWAFIGTCRRQAAHTRGTRQPLKSHRLRP